MQETETQAAQPAKVTLRQRLWRMLPRYSLCTQVLFVLLVGSGTTLWWRWEPWAATLSFPREFFEPNGIFSNDGRYLDVEYPDHHRIDLRTGRNLFAAKGFVSSIYGSHNNERLLVVFRGKPAELTDSDGDVVAVFPATAKFGQISRSGKLAVLDSAIFECTPLKQRCNVNVPLDDNWISYEFSPNDDWLVVRIVALNSDRTGVTRIFETRTGSLAGELKGDLHCISADGKRLFLCDRWETRVHRLEPPFVLEATLEGLAAISPDRAFLLTYWDEQMREKGQTFYVTGVRFGDAPDINVRLWDTNTLRGIPNSDTVFKSTGRHPTPVWAGPIVAFSDLVLNARTGQRALEKSAEAASSLVLSKGGNLAAINKLRENTATLINLTNNQVVGRLPMMVDDVSRDGSCLVNYPDKRQVWSRRRPEAWWGIAWLPEFWLSVVFAGLLVWSIRRDRRDLKRAALKPAIENPKSKI